MSFKEFGYKLFIQFLVLVTCISIAMGVLGLIFDAERQFGYGAHFAPIIYAAMAVIIQLITYSKKEMSVRRVIVSKVIKFIAYAGVLLIMNMGVPGVTIVHKIVLVVSIPVVAVAVTLLTWIIDKHKAKELKKDLDIFKSRVSAEL